jgi:hypothetical protein
MSQSSLDALDALFTARGLTTTPSALRASPSWTGTIGGRSVSVVCSLRRRTVYYGEIRGSRYQGHEFVIEVGTPLRTRLTATTAAGAPAAGKLERMLYRRVGLVPLEPPEPAYAHLKLAAFERPWALALLADGRIRRLVTETLVAPGETGAVFAFQPGFVMSRRRRALEEITPDLAAGLLDATLAAADIAESMPAPTREAVPTRLERYARERPGAFVALLFAVLLGGVLLVSAIVLPLLFLVAKYAGQGYILLAGIAGWFWWRRRKKRAARARAAGG